VRNAVGTPLEYIAVGEPMANRPFFERAFLVLILALTAVLSACGQTIGPEVSRGSLGARRPVPAMMR